MRTPNGAGSRSATRRSAAAIVAVLIAVPSAACGDDGSARDRYCEAGESLQSSVSSLASVDVIAEGTSGIQDAIETVRDDVDELLDSASDAASGDVDALDDAVDELNDALDAAGDELSEENANAVLDAISAVQAAFGAVTDTLSDC